VLVSIGLPSSRDIIREEGRRKEGRKKRGIDSEVKLARLLGLSPSLLYSPITKASKVVPTTYTPIGVYSN